MMNTFLKLARIILALLLRTFEINNSCSNKLCEKNKKMVYRNAM